MSRIGRVALGLLMTVACLVAPAEAATAAGRDVLACDVTYRSVQHWDGFTARITIGNTGTATINGWTLIFRLNEGVEIVDVWNARLTSTSGTIIAHNVQHNGVVERDSSIDVGFRANGIAGRDPSTFTVNGTICS